MKRIYALIAVVLCVVNARAGVFVGPGGGSGANPTGNGSGLTNLNGSSLTGGLLTYTSSIKTNTVYVYMAGSNPVNGTYVFYTNDTSGDTLNVYTNALHNGVFLFLDISASAAAFTTNYLDLDNSVDGATGFYEFDNITSVTNLMLTNGWTTNGSIFTGLMNGSLPAPITQFAQSYINANVPPVVYTNLDVYYDSLNGNDTPGAPPGPLNPFLTWTNTLTYAASHPFTHIYVVQDSNAIPTISFIPDYTTVTGRGRLTTHLYANTNNGSVTFTTESQFILGNNVVLKDLYLGGDVFASANTNLVENCWIQGVIDGFYLTGVCSGFRAINCDVWSGWDTLNSSQCILTNRADFVHCRFHALGSLPNNGSQPSPGLLRCASLGSGNYYFDGCTFAATGVPIGSTNSQNSCIQIVATGATAYVSGAQFIYNTTNTFANGSWARAVSYVGAGANTNAVFEFDGCIPNFSTNDVMGGTIQMLGAVPGTNVTGSVYLTSANIGTLTVTNGTITKSTSLTRFSATTLTNMTGYDTFALFNLTGNFTNYLSGGTAIITNVNSLTAEFYSVPLSPGDYINASATMTGTLRVFP